MNWKLVHATARLIAKLSITKRIFPKQMPQRRLHGVHEHGQREIVKI